MAAEECNIKAWEKARREDVRSLESRMQNSSSESSEQELETLKLRAQECPSPETAETIYSILNSYCQIKSLSRRDPAYHKIEARIHSQERGLRLEGYGEHQVLFKLLEDLSTTWMVSKYSEYIALNFTKIKDRERIMVDAEYFGEDGETKLANEDWAVILEHYEEEEAGQQADEEEEQDEESARKSPCVSLLWEFPHRPLHARLENVAWNCNMNPRDLMQQVKLYQHYNRDDDLADYTIVGSAPQTTDASVSSPQSRNLPTLSSTPPLTEILQLDDCREIATFIIRDRTSLENWHPPPRYIDIKHTLLKGFEHFQKRHFSEIPSQIDTDTQLVSATEEWMVNAEEWPEKMNGINTERHERKLNEIALAEEAKEIEEIRAAGGLTEEQVDQAYLRWPDDLRVHGNDFLGEAYDAVDRIAKHMDDMWQEGKSCQEPFVGWSGKKAISLYLGFREIVKRENLDVYDPYHGLDSDRSDR